MTQQTTKPTERAPQELDWWPGFCLSLALVSGLLAVFGHNLELFGVSVPTKVLLAIAIILLVPVLLTRPLRQLTSVPVALHIVLIPLVVVVLSNWLSRPYSLFQGPLIRGELFLGFLCILALGRARFVRVLPALAILAPVALAATLLFETDGELIFSDDHPVFLFRLISLVEAFPWIPTYNPLWNAGLDGRDFFATGALAPFFIFAPILYFVDLFSFYNLLVVLVIFGLVPLSTAYAARIYGLNRTGQAIAALLSVSHNLLWYRWSLSYGTMGFITSAALMPLNIALGIELLRAPGQFSWQKSLALCTTLTLMLFWSASAIALLPLAIWGLCFIPRLLRYRNPRLLIAVLLAINIPWMVLFWSVSNVGRFLETPKPSFSQQAEQAAPSAAPVSVQAPERSVRAIHDHDALTVTALVKGARAAVVSMNPLIYMLFIPGLLLLPPGSRIMVASLALWLWFLGIVGAPLKPQLELDRMLVLFSLVACIPVARVLELLLAPAPRGLESDRARWCLTAVGASFLVVGVFIVASIMERRSLEHFTTADETVTDLAAVAKREAGSGRLLFSGFVLHELRGGHLAPLPFLNGVPTMASSYAHDQWRYKQVFPLSVVARGLEGINEYLDHHNVTLVAAHEPGMLQRFREAPDQFTRVWKGGKFTLFKRAPVAGGYFESGTGEILAQTVRGVTVRVDSPEAVLRFRYFPFLQLRTLDGSATSCTMAPHQIGDYATFIRLENCAPGTTLQIEAVNPLRRFLIQEGLL